ncbi:exodeoxyribonuclease VII small subunit [Parasalinivibrio latis]|uniref:exodeoxyribonuclease VII small subunit n=1 Tax=Parasalinivibrio latis TaxID=2952610 RepID=UPI0030DF6449
MAAQKKPENMSFEETLGELDTLVDQLEKGELSLEDALKKFERGISLVREGQQRLTQAQQRVDILMTQSDDDPLTPFEADIDE